MSSDDIEASSTHGGDGGRDTSSIARLEDKLHGMSLRNTEDVDQTTNYAPPVTKEVVKPIVHEQVEEHITRDIHAHDVYHKILPVRDVEVLPARHWVPGPDGRLIQVDEKDVYSGAAFNLGQTSRTAVVGGVEHGQGHQSTESYGHVDAANPNTDRQVTVNQPEVLPGHVRQVVETQVHQPEMDRYQVGLGQIDRSQGNQESVNPLGQHPTSQREVTPGQPHQSQVQQHQVDQHQIPRKPVNQEQSNTGHVTFTQAPISVSRYEASPDLMRQSRETELPDPARSQQRRSEAQAGQGQPESSTRRGIIQPSPSPYEVYETNPDCMDQIHHSQEGQRRSTQDQIDPQAEQDQLDRQLQQDAVNRSSPFTAKQTHDSRRQGAQGLFQHKDEEEAHAEQNRAYQERGVEAGDKHHGQHHKHAQKGSRDSVNQRSVDHAGADTAQQSGNEQRTEHGDGRVSPGLLDPYRVKNGPVHHADQGGLSDGVDRQEPTVQKIAGHGVLTAEDGKGHKKLHKEPRGQ